MELNYVVPFRSKTIGDTVMGAHGEIILAVSSARHRHDATAAAQMSGCIYAASVRRDAFPERWLHPPRGDTLARYICASGAHPDGHLAWLV